MSIDTTDNKEIIEYAKERAALHRDRIPDGPMPNTFKHGHDSGYELGCAHTYEAIVKKLSKE